jgi:hypothetical protein
MPYLISAISPEGMVSFRSKTPAEALQTAVELMGFGLKEVCITDAGECDTLTPTLRVFTPYRPPKAPNGGKPAG